MHIEFNPVEEGKPFDISKDMFDKICVQVCEAGANVIKRHMQAKAPHPHLVPHVRATRVYSTPSDGSTKITAYFGGYLPLRGKRKYWSRYNKRGGTLYKTTEGVSANFLSAIFAKGRPNGARFPIRNAFINQIPRKAVNDAMMKAFNEALQREMGK